MKYDVFLSYAIEDTKRVQNLYRRLRKGGLSCWMDKPPHPWQQDGLAPGENWDLVIRRRLHDSKIILAILSKASVAKQGYVQREFRLALQVAAERPPNSIAVIPVLLEDCKLPDFRIDTMSFQQIQWYELHKQSISDLISILRRAVGWQPVATIDKIPPSQKRIQHNQINPVMDFLATIERPEPQYMGNSPLEILKRALASVQIGDFEGAYEQLQFLHFRDKRRALRTLLRVADRHVATLGMMMLVGYIQHIHGVPKGKDFALLESHVVPEVAILATASLTKQGTRSKKLDRLLREYADSPRRLLGFHDVLRWHVHFGSILSLANSHPRFVWELMANNPQFSMKGMRFMPMIDEGKKLTELASSTTWETREIGVGIHCSDASVPLETRLRFLADEEPRVRFRALEGILMDHNEKKDIGLILEVLKANPKVKKDTRSWTVQQIIGSPELWLVCLDDPIQLPIPLSNSFSDGNYWAVQEAIDIPTCRLSGLTAIMPEVKEKQYRENIIEKALLSRVKGVNRHWILDVLQQRHN